MSLLLLIYFLATLAIVATALPFWRTDRWWVRICDFPRFQIAILAVVLLVALLVTRWPGSLTDWIVSFLLAAVVGWQSSWVWRYLPGAPKEVEQSPSSRDHPKCVALLTGNVMQTNRDAEQLLKVIALADPDVILLAEIDDWWAGQLSHALDAKYPHRVCQSLATGYGIALFSRRELVEPSIRYVVDPTIPSIRTGLRLRSGDVVDLYGMHPQPPAPGQDSGERDTELLAIGREIKARGRPAIVLGDLNDVAWSRTTLQFQEEGGLLDPRRGRGFFSTFHAKLPGLRYPLDYIFHTRHFRVCGLRILPRFGSDHLPLLATLCYE